MTELNKLVRKIDELDEINKINEIIDALNGGVSIIVDAELNEASINPVQNATITSALSEKQDLLVAGTGLSLSGTTLNHLNTITSGSTGTSEASSGSTISIPYVEYDSTGHIISKGNRTHTITGFLTSSDITEKADLSELSDVALTGDYADLINTPSIPETYSDVGAASENHSHTYSDVGALSASTSIPVVTDTYSSTSSDAMSGKAVKSAIDTAISSVYRPAGSVAFNNLPTPGASYEGNVYNLTEEFTTDGNFIEGSGKKYPAGTNVVVIKIDASTYKFDVLSGIVDLSNYQQINTAVTHTSGTSVGDETTPIYITSSGAVSELSYTIAKSVPSDAIFTDTTYTAGTGISISDQGVISNTQTSAEWGNISGTLTDQTDLCEALNNKQDILTAGTGISISNNNVISVTIEGSSTPAGNYSYSTVSPALTPSNGICTWQITHNLDTSDVICSLYVNDVEVEKNVQINNDNTITVTFNSAESLLAEACKIVVVSNGGTSSGNIDTTGYLAPNTIITVGVDKDFTDIQSAFNYLTNKWSTGLITIQIDSGTFTTTSPINLDNKFNIPYLWIKGVSKASTIINKTVNTDNNEAAIFIKDQKNEIKISNLTVSTVCSKDSMCLHVNNSNVVLGDVKLKNGALCCLNNQFGSTCRLFNTVDILNDVTSNTTYGIIASVNSRLITDGDTTINFTKIINGFLAEMGGINAIFFCKINTSNVTTEYVPALNSYLSGGTGFNLGTAS